MFRPGHIWMLIPMISLSKRRLLLLVVKEDLNLFLLPLLYYIHTLDLGYWDRLKRLLNKHKSRYTRRTALREFFVEDCEDSFLISIRNSLFILFWSTTITIQRQFLQIFSFWIADVFFCLFGVYRDCQDLLLLCLTFCCTILFNGPLAVVMVIRRDI